MFSATLVLPKSARNLTPHARNFRKVDRACGPAKLVGPCWASFGRCCESYGSRRRPQEKTLRSRVG
jgi:hypothetical protein